MGNTATKEARPYGPSPRYSHVRGASNVSNNGDQGQQHGAESSRHGGSSRQRAGEHRRETRQEREARKLEKERVARVKERERSMKEEHVDGGYLVTQGVYVGTEDFSKPVVRQLMIERKLAPFWKGLNDFSDSWAEHQLMAAARGLPIPPPDEVPPELEYRITSKSPDERAAAEKNLNSLTVPISSRSQSFNSDSSSTRPKSPSVPPPHTPSSPGSSTTHLFRGRAKTLASLTTKTSSSDMAPREFQLPPDPFVNGQPIEAYLYKAASECPICFLYYPPYLNRTRCCDQPICSECFVQIKRPDPHPPEHEQPDGSTPPPSNNDPNQTEGQLVSEPAACPFCVQPEFGVTYASPPFRRGLTYAASYTHPLAHAASPASSSSSLVSGNASPQPAVTRRRATSLSANSPGVITTDKIRPDWAHKLATARAHAARRSAAATALHTAAYLMNSPSNEGRNFGGVSRRAMLRRAAGQGSESPGSRPGYLSTLQTAGDNRRANQLERENSGNNDEDATNLAPPRASSRRTRMDELEDMMMMEAIRLSLAAEEERRKKQEKEARKDAKKREKETKKAEKYARKNGLYSNNPSNVALNTPSSRTPPVRVDSGSSSVATEELSASKGKEVERPADSSPSPASSSSEAPKLSLGKLDDGQPSSPLFAPSQAEPSKKSHLRHASSASSSNSSLIESTSGENIGDGTPPRCAGSSAEPMFNFRSLAEVIGDEDKDSTEHVEHTTQAQARASVQQGPVPVEQACSTLGSELAPKEAPELRIGNGSSDNKRHDDTIDQKELQPRSVEVTPNSAQDLEASG